MLVGHASTNLASFLKCATPVLDHFPAGVCMHESNAQIGTALRSSREQVNVACQVAGGVQNATNFDIDKHPPQQTPSFSDANAGVANSQWKVMVWESQTSRRRLIDRVVSDCGAQAHGVEDLGAIERAPCSSCCAAVIALGT